MTVQPPQTCCPLVPTPHTTRTPRAHPRHHGCSPCCPALRMPAPSGSKRSTSNGRRRPRSHTSQSLYVLAAVPYGNRSGTEKGGARMRLAPSKCHHTPETRTARHWCYRSDYAPRSLVDGVFLASSSCCRSGYVLRTCAAMWSPYYDFEPWPRAQGCACLQVQTGSWW